MNPQYKVDETLNDKARTVAADSRELIHDAKNKAESLGAQAAAQTESAMYASGEKLTSLADTVRAHAPANGHGGGMAASGADALDRSGAYLKQADLADVGPGIKDVIRRHPLQALAVGLGLGLYVVRAMRS